MAGFDKEQLEQLRELFEAQDVRLVHELDRRFGEQRSWVEGEFAQQRTWVEGEFTKQRTWLSAKFEEERAYYGKLIRQELADIRRLLQELSDRTDEDDRDARGEIAVLKRRLTRAEAQIKALQATTH